MSLQAAKDLQGERNAVRMLPSHMGGQQMGRGWRGVTWAVNKSSATVTTFPLTSLLSTAAHQSLTSSSKGYSSTEVKPPSPPKRAW